MQLHRPPIHVHPNGDDSAAGTVDAPKRTLLFKEWRNTVGGNTVGPGTWVRLPRGVDCTHTHAYLGVTLPDGVMLGAYGEPHAAPPLLRATHDASAEPWILRLGSGGIVDGIELDCSTRPDISGIVVQDVNDVQIHNVSIRGVHLSPGAKHLRCPVRIIGTGPQVSGVRIRGLRVHGCGHTGLHFTGTVTGATVEHTTISDAAQQAPGHGISIYSHKVVRAAFPPFTQVGGTLYTFPLSFLGLTDVGSLNVRPVHGGPQYMALDRAVGTEPLQPGEYRVVGPLVHLNCGVPLPVGAQTSVLVDACQQPISGVAIRKSHITRTRDTRWPGNNTPEGIAVAFDDFAEFNGVYESTLSENEGLAVSMNLGRGNRVENCTISGNRAGAVGGVTRAAHLLNNRIDGPVGTSEFGAGALISLIPPVTPASRQPNRIEGGSLIYTGRDTTALLVAGSRNHTAPTVQMTGVQVNPGPGRLHGTGEGPADGGWVHAVGCCPA
jgi:hypothetical protein